MANTESGFLGSSIEVGIRIETIGNTLFVRVTDEPGRRDFSYLAHTSETEGDRDKLYLSAYFGSEQSGRLRSLSGQWPAVGQRLGRSFGGTLMAPNPSRWGNPIPVEGLPPFPFTNQVLLSGIRKEDVDITGDRFSDAGNSLPPWPICNTDLFSWMRDPAIGAVLPAVWISPGNFTPDLPPWPISNAQFLNWIQTTPPAQAVFRGIWIVTPQVRTILTELSVTNIPPANASANNVRKTTSTHIF